MSNPAQSKYTTAIWICQTCGHRIEHYYCVTENPWDDCPPCSKCNDKTKWLSWGWGYGQPNPDDVTRSISSIIERIQMMREPF